MKFDFINICADFDGTIDVMGDAIFRLGRQDRSTITIGRKMLEKTLDGQIQLVKDPKDITLRVAGRSQDLTMAQYNAWQNRNGVSMQVFRQIAAKEKWKFPGYSLADEMFGLPRGHSFNHADQNFSVPSHVFDEGDVYRAEILKGNFWDEFDLRAKAGKTCKNGLFLFIDDDMNETTFAHLYTHFRTHPEEIPEGAVFRMILTTWANPTRSGNYEVAYPDIIGTGKVKPQCKYNFIAARAQAVEVENIAASVNAENSNSCSNSDSESKTEAYTTTGVTSVSSSSVNTTQSAISVASSDDDFEANFLRMPPIWRHTFICQLSEENPEAAQRCIAILDKHRGAQQMGAVQATTSTSSGIHIEQKRDMSSAPLQVPAEYAQFPWVYTELNKLPSAAAKIEHLQNLHLKFTLDFEFVRKLSEMLQMQEMQALATLSPANTATSSQVNSVHEEKQTADQLSVPAKHEQFKWVYEALNKLADIDAKKAHVNKLVINGSLPFEIGSQLIEALEVQEQVKLISAISSVPETSSSTVASSGADTEIKSDSLNLISSASSSAISSSSLSSSSSPKKTESSESNYGPWEKDFDQRTSRQAKEKFIRSLRLYGDNEFFNILQVRLQSKLDEDPSLASPSTVKQSSSLSVSTTSSSTTSPGKSAQQSQQSQKPEVKDILDVGVLSTVGDQSLLSSSISSAPAVVSAATTPANSHKATMPPRANAVHEEKQTADQLSVPVKHEQDRWVYEALNKLAGIGAKKKLVNNLVSNGTLPFDIGLELTDALEVQEAEKLFSEIPSASATSSASAIVSSSVGALGVVSAAGAEIKFESSSSSSNLNSSSSSSSSSSPLASPSTLKQSSSVSSAISSATPSVKLAQQSKQSQQPKVKDILDIGFLSTLGNHALLSSSSSIAPNASAAATPATSAAADDALANDLLKSSNNNPQSNSSASASSSSLAAFFAPPTEDLSDAILRDALNSTFSK